MKRARFFILLIALLPIGQLQAQEEELRQNTEEMLATQEELSRKIQSLEDEKKELTVRYEKEIKALKSGG